jgi:outer membrane protein TolC
MRPVVMLALPVLLLAAAAPAAPMTAEDAVRIALEKSPAILRSEASVLSARSGLWSAYSRVLPSVSADASRDGSFTRESAGTRAFGTFTFPSTSFDSEQYSGSYGLSGQWSVFDPSGIAGLSSARSGMRAANLSHQATRSDVRLETKRRFYSVVKAMHLAGVSSQALRLARDDERRVRALFEVGSVSKSELLRAQVRTAQSQLDSILADHAVVTQRLSLAQQLSLRERELGDVDSALTSAGGPAALDAAAVLEEARRQRPDLRAAEADVRAAELGLRSAHWARLPSVTLQGSFTPKSLSSSRYYADSYKPLDSLTTTAFESKSLYSGRVAVNLNVFDGFATDSRVAAARSRMVLARQTRDALVRDLEGEVRQTLLNHQEAFERETLARRSLASASENLNLVQQKYNVGSATILDLIDAQVALQRAQSDLVSALADIRVAEAAVDRVRGKGE